MGVVTVSSSASRTPLGLSTNLSTHHRSTLKKPLILAFKADNSNKTSLVAPHEPVILPIETRKEIQNRVRKAKKPSNRVKAVVTDEVSTSTMEVDYNEAAAKLENIFKLSPARTATSDVDCADGLMSRGRRRRRVSEGDDRTSDKASDTVIRSRSKKAKRLSLDKRIALKRNKEDKEFVAIGKRKLSGSEKSKKEKEVVLVRKRKDSENENEKIENLVREYSASTDLVSLDWKKMKIPPVLPSSEHTWLFKLMQPMKVRQF